MSIGYYEAWNMDRGCMRMAISDISKLNSTYTHVHWVFGTINENLTLTINDDTFEQFGSFLNLTDTKRIMSFGGWDFSTSPATYQLFREAVSAESRGNFTDDVVAFLQRHGVDGVDFDWEYPGVGTPELTRDKGTLLVYARRI